MDSNTKTTGPVVRTVATDIHVNHTDSKNIQGRTCAT